MEEFASTYQFLSKQCGYYSRHLGHLKGLLDNDDWLRVVDKSGTGRVLLMGNSEITNALILFNTRMLDQGQDTITLWKLSKQLPSNEAISGHHRKRMQKVGIKYPLERYHYARDEFIAIRRQLKKNETETKLRHLRNYTLAHNIEPEAEPDRATLNDLIALTTIVFEAVDKAGYIVESASGAYKQFTEISERETRELLSVLPELSKVERLP